MRTTFIAKTAEIERKWYVVDATDLTLGRLASQVAAVLRGKNKPIYTPHIDTGDYVIVVNADKIKVTGKKMEQKLYRRHSDYVGGFKETTLREMMEKKPEEVVAHAVSGMLPKMMEKKPCEVIKHAVKGMLPKNTLGKDMLKKLYVYADAEHGHEAQKPEALELRF